MVVENIVIITQRSYIRSTLLRVFGFLTLVKRKFILRTNSEHEINNSFFTNRIFKFKFGMDKSVPSSLFVRYVYNFLSGLSSLRVFAMVARG